MSRCPARRRHDRRQWHSDQLHAAITTNAGKARFRGVELETNCARRPTTWPRAGDRLTWPARSAISTPNISSSSPSRFDPVTGSVAPTIDVADFRKIQNTPKWTLSGSLDYDTPAGRRPARTPTRPCRIAARASSSNCTIPRLDQRASPCGTPTSSGARPATGSRSAFTGRTCPTRNISSPAIISWSPEPAHLRRSSIRRRRLPLSRRSAAPGVLTAFYGKPRQVWLSAAVNF